LVGNRHRKTGFTLIELLVVLAVIGILAAILFPTFARVQEKGRQAVCESTLRHLGLAVMQYVQDSDGVLPGATDGHTGVGVRGGWLFYTAFRANTAPGAFQVSQGSLYPYVANAQAYVCPDDAQGMSSGDSYAINACVDDGAIVNGIRRGKHLSAFDNPASWMLFGEEASGDYHLSSTNDGYFDWKTDGLSERHSEGQNITFLDGHAHWYQTSDIIANNWVSGGSDPTTACPLQ
jgi:prepilin-type N-terminal cleavage/methylation domain-containing protein/prepilin-type processing-associated H-X9-DG protein